jgi:hypothetical protein
MHRDLELEMEMGLRVGMWDPGLKVVQVGTGAMEKEVLEINILEM